MSDSLFLSALLLGLSAGLAPGPLLTLVISETMRHGSGAGTKVALAPLLTDLPIILLTSMALGGLSRFQPLLGGISWLGGLVVMRMGYDCLHTKGLGPLEAGPMAPPPNSLVKGVAVNLLSPHPWLFWFGVGGPLLLKAASISALTAAGFLAAFYLLLVGAKLLIAWLVGGYRRLLSGPAYLSLMRFLGVMLVVYSILLFKDGFHLLRG